MLTSSGRRVLAAAAAVAFGALLSGCSSDASGTPPAAPADPDPRPAKTVRVVSPGRAADHEAYPSHLYAEKDVLVTARSSGLIEQIRVDRGGLVRAGQPLAVMETDLASSELAMAEQELRLAEAEYDRARSLHEQGVISPQEFLRAEIARDKAASKTELMRGLLERCTVRAPFDGQVVERWAVVGQRVQEDQGTPLFRVVAREPHRARVDVPEERLAGIRAGTTTATLRVDGREDDFPARVVFVSPAVDPASGTAAAIVETRSTDPALRLGAAVTVRFDGDGAGRSDPLVVPRDAFPRASLWKGRTADIFVVSEGRARTRRVEVVDMREGHVWVVGDLEPTDLVILGAGPAIADGDAVSALERES